MLSTDFRTSDTRVPNLLCKGQGKPFGRLNLENCQEVTGFGKCLSGYWWRMDQRGIRPNEGFAIKSEMMVACLMGWDQIDGFGINYVGFCHLNIGHG